MARLPASKEQEMRTGNLPYLLWPNPSVVKNYAVNTYEF